MLLEETSGDISTIVEQACNPYDLRTMFRHLSDLVSAAPDGDDDDDKNDDDDGDDDDGADGSGGTGKSDDDDKDDVDDPDKKRLSDEAAKWRRLRREERLAREAAEAKVREFESKDKSDTEKLEADLATVTTERDSLKSQVSEYAREVAIARGAAGKNVSDLEMLGYFLDKEKVEYLDEDGDIADLGDAIERLLKKKPSLAATGSGKDDEGDDDDTTSTTATGKRSDGKDKKKNGVDQEALKKKFPALAR